MLDVLEEKEVKDSPYQEKLDTYISGQKAELINAISLRNSKFFDEEMQKLDKWAEDRKNSLEIALKQLDKDIKTQKTESKKILKLEEKIKAQKQIKEMETKRNKMRRDLYDAQDAVDHQKDELIEKAEANLLQKIEEKDLFLIRWKLI